MLSTTRPPLLDRLVKNREGTRPISGSSSPILRVVYASPSSGNLASPTTFSMEASYQELGAAGLRTNTWSRTQKPTQQWNYLSVVDGKPLQPDLRSDSARTVTRVSRDVHCQ